MLTALNPVTLPIEDRYPLTARLTSATGMNPVVVNDAQAAAWGEYTFGAGRGCRSFMFVTVSTGVGGGLVFGGRLQIGAVGLAGHVGHMTVPGGLGCGCGRHGCLETIASGTSIARRFSELAARQVGAPAVERIAIGGGVGLAPGFLERVRKHVGQLPDIFQRPIVAAQAGNDAGMIGVARLA
jgi:N-acylmannosamine kinase